LKLVEVLNLREWQIAGRRRRSGNGGLDLRLCLLLRLHHLQLEVIQLGLNSLTLGNFLADTFVDVLLNLWRNLRRNGIVFGIRCISILCVGTGDRLGWVRFCWCGLCSLGGLGDLFRGCRLGLGVLGLHVKQTLSGLGDTQVATDFGIGFCLGRLRRFSRLRRSGS